MNHQVHQIDSEKKKVYSDPELLLKVTVEYMESVWLGPGQNIYS